MISCRSRNDQFYDAYRLFTVFTTFSTVKP